MRKSAYFIVLFTLMACTSPQVQKPSDSSRTPALTSSYAVMADGYRLPVTAWEADAPPGAVVLALHGFNDYRNAFEGPARFFAAKRIMTYAYDQRGFGETAQRGLWPVGGVLESDAATMANLLCDRHPDLPLFLLGESMGGAVLLNMPRQVPCLRGMVLVGPAVWGWQEMPFWQRYALKVAAHITPGKMLTGEGLEITPSDNIEMLRALGRDPLVIKATRIDALYGLTNLMAAALQSSSTLTIPTLILYGEKDEVIPPAPTCAMLDRLPDIATTRVVLYPDGYHMLLRDLRAAVVLQDTVNWIQDQSALLPSTLDVSAGATRARELCSDI
jgi:acylglycerol lipase